MTFYNNSAQAYGGGAIYIDGGILTLGTGVAFVGNSQNDLTISGGSVQCLNPAFTTNCTGCTGSFDVPASCPLCSSPTPSTCTSCPQGTYGGAEAKLACELCPAGYTTFYPPSSTSSSDCVLITSAPSLRPTQNPTTQVRRALYPFSLPQEYRQASGLRLRLSSKFAPTFNQQPSNLQIPTALVWPTVH